MSKTISHRIYDFLKEHPPFSFFEKNKLMSISSGIKVLYREKGDFIFKQGEMPEDYIYVVREGAIELYNEYETGKFLVDICDEGDIFGIRTIFNKEHAYTLTAYVSEESLLFKIPSEPLIAAMQKNMNVKNFFMNSFVAGVRNPYKSQIKNGGFTPCADELLLNEELTEIQSIDLKKETITCKLGTTIKTAAKAMRENNIGSIIIVNDKIHPAGIVTDRDLRNKVVPGDVSLDAKIEDIMSSPVITMPNNVTVADIHIKMIENNIHHICITEDGTSDSSIIGIVSEHDILLTKSNNPSAIIRGIKRAQSGKDLKALRANAHNLMRNYLMHGVSIEYITRIVTEINNYLTTKAIETAIMKLEKNNYPPPDVKWCWLAIGSQGRGEQLLMSDQDNALLFEDVAASEYKSVKIYFLELAKIVTGILNECGFEYCPSNMMASNPHWCLSLSEWKEQFRNWIFTPGEKEVMYSTIFFDYRPLFGEAELAKELSSSIDEYISQQESFLSFLAKNALQNPPPVGFFRNFMLEHDGEHKNEFDVKARAIMPLVDAARVLALSNKLQGFHNTGKRFRKLAEIEKQNAEIFEQAADAFEIFIHFRTLEGIKNENKGRYFKPEDLNKMQRVMLRNSFKPIKEIQNILSIRFNTDLFR